MAIKIGESSEIKIPLKNLIMIIAFTISCAYFVFHIEERLDLLDNNTMIMR